MKKTNHVLCLLLFSLISLWGFAQEIENVEEKKRFFAKPDKYNLTFRLDYSLTQFSKNHSFRYEGERYSSATDQFAWITLDSTLLDFNRLSNDVNIKFDLLISTVEPLSIGLTYHILSYKLSTSTNFQSGIYYDVFLGLGALIDYRWNVPGVKGVIINPTATIGYYVGNEDYSGKGREAYYNLKLAALYNLWDKLDIRAYTDYSLWRYNEDSPSVIFPERNRIVKSHINHMNFGLGLAYRFHLIPD